MSSMQMAGDSMPMMVGDLMITMEMLQVIKMGAPKGPIPPGLKVIALANPDGTQSTPLSPVLAIGGFTLWPMSYMDNRMSFGMVMYDLKWNPVHVVEKTGARYIFNITKAGTGQSGSVTFIGQANNSVTMQLAEICALVCE